MPGTAGEIAAYAQRVNPKGKTPLTDGDRQVADALLFTEEKSTVIARSMIAQQRLLGLGFLVGLTSG